MTSKMTTSSAQITCRTIDRIHVSQLSSQQFFQCYKKPGIPVVITGILPKQSDWNLEYLSEQLGSQEFVLRYYGRDRYQQAKSQWQNIGSGVTAKTKTFDDYAELLRSGEAYEQDIYLAKCPLHHTALMQTEEIAAIRTKLDDLGFTKPASTLNLWVGPGGHTEALHYDPMDGTLIQLHGSKRLVLFPRSQTANLYPYPFYLHLWHGLKLRSWFSQVYPDRPDFEAFPKLQIALNHRYEVVLNAGEILYIPAGWWHEVTSLGNEMVCSVNRFWRIFPASRAILFWGRWRAYLGSFCAIPRVILSVIVALFGPNRQQRIKEIMQML